MDRAERVTGILAAEATPQATIPIQATIERVAARVSGVSVYFGPGPDSWRRAADIVDSPAAVNDLLDEVCRLYEMDNRQVAASFLVLGYFWHIMAAATACYLLENRVPDLSAGAIALDLRGGITFLSPHCWALPGDPDAQHPTVTVVANQQELRERLTSQFEEHAAPLFATLRSVAPYGLNGMRANYADRLASAVIWIAEQVGDLDLARREVPALVSLARPNGRTGILEVEHAGRSGIFLNRGGCCLNYRLPGREKCDTCCLRPLEERIALCRAYLEGNGQIH